MLINAWEWFPILFWTFLETFTFRLNVGSNIYFGPLVYCRHTLRNTRKAQTCLKHIRFGNLRISNLEHVCKYAFQYCFVFWKFAILRYWNCENRYPEQFKLWSFEALDFDTSELGHFGTLELWNLWAQKPRNHFWIPVIFGFWLHSRIAI